MYVLPSGCWLPFSLIFTCCAENERFQNSGLPELRFSR